MINKIRSLKHLLFGKTKSKAELEQTIVLKELEPVFKKYQQKNGYWTSKLHYSNYLSPKRIDFIQRLLKHVEKEVRLDDIFPKSYLDVSFGSGYLPYYFNKNYPSFSISGTELNELIKLK